MTEPKPEPTPTPSPRTVPKPLDLDVELVPEQTVDDTDSGWGAESRTEQDPAALLRRYLDETPPHHGD
jgi:hypothetical protein